MYLIDSIGFSNRLWPFIFIGWGGLIPQKILLQDLNLLKSLVILGFHLDRSDRSVVPDRLQTLRPVRPLERTGQTSLYILLSILVVNRQPAKIAKFRRISAVQEARGCIQMHIFPLHQTREGSHWEVCLSLRGTIWIQCIILDLGTVHVPRGHHDKVQTISAPNPSKFDP